MASRTAIDWIVGNTGGSLPLMVELRPFQKRFIKEAIRPGIDTATLSLPRGNGKSWLAG